MPLAETILRLLGQLESGDRSMPATILYNEGWMLRLVLDAGASGFLPSVLPRGVRWYSEAQLRTPFGKDRGPNHESNTHADGVVGDFANIGDTKSGIELLDNAKLFLVFEAKMYAALSTGTKNAPGFDQAARNVACMAHTLQQSRRRADSLDKVGFFVVAPQSQIDSGLFESAMNPDSIRSRVAERIQSFTGSSRDALIEWQNEWFQPLLAKMTADDALKCLSWEELGRQIASANADRGVEVSQFYDKCRQYNLPIARSSKVVGQLVKGMEYELLTGVSTGSRVRVCSVGRSNSRVYRIGSRDDAFLVPNGNLQLVPEAEQTPPPPDPLAEHVYSWKNQQGAIVTVRVIRVGDCNSRVILVDGGQDSFLVPNHQLYSVN